MAGVTPKELTKAAMDAGVKESAEGVKWIKKVHGVDLRPQVFGRCRTQIEGEAKAAGVQVPVQPVAGVQVGSGVEVAKPGITKLILTIDELMTQYGRDLVLEAVEICRLLQPAK